MSKDDVDYGTHLWVLVGTSIRYNDGLFIIIDVWQQGKLATVHI